MNQIELYQAEMEELLQSTQQDIDEYNTLSNEDKNKRATELISTFETRAKRIPNILTEINTIATDFEKVISETKAVAIKSNGKINEHINTVRTSMKAHVLEVLNNLKGFIDVSAFNAIQAQIEGDKKEKVTKNGFKDVTKPTRTESNGSTVSWADEVDAEEKEREIEGWIGVGNGGKAIVPVKSYASATAVSVIISNSPAPQDNSTKLLKNSQQPITEESIYVSKTAYYKAILVNEFTDAMKYPGRICYSRKYEEACIYLIGIGFFHGNLPTSAAREQVTHCTVLCCRCKPDNINSKCSYAHNSYYTKQKEEFNTNPFTFQNLIPYSTDIDDHIEKIERDRNGNTGFSTNGLTTNTLFATGHFMMSMILTSAIITEKYGPNYQNQVQVK